MCKALKGIFSLISDIKRIKILPILKDKDVLNNFHKFNVHVLPLPCQYKVLKVR